MVRLVADRATVNPWRRKMKMRWSEAPRCPGGIGREIEQQAVEIGAERAA